VRTRPSIDSQLKKKKPNLALVKTAAVGLLAAANAVSTGGQAVEVVQKLIHALGSLVG
jgi:hypothetical protein